VSAAVPIAQGTNDANLSTITRLTAVEKKVSTLQKQVKALQAVATCLTFKAAGVTEYGDPPNHGYTYVDNTKVPVAQFLTTSLDFTESGDTSDAIIPVVDPACVQGDRSPAAHGLRQDTPRRTDLLDFRPAR
jgi:hypothetical protein